MRRMVVILLGLVLVATAGCRPKIDIAAETAAIKTVLDNYIISIEKEDMELYGKVMAHDSEMVNFGTSEPPILGWPALKKLIEDQNAALTQTQIAARDINVRIAPSGNFAWVTDLWDFKAMMGDQLAQIPVRCTWILEKRAGGWVIVHFHKSVAAIEG
ncbi:MAG: nuclear transport factor 2 family protein [Candidatus Eisenbacteria bacterium]